ncbi:MAG TPA: hypothetical protein VFQ50_00455 [Flavobacterium sp.]|nr:hypothetical protein [Flavobacterium sp.]
MKILACLLLIISFALPNLVEVRKQYTSASETASKSELFAELLSPIAKSDSKTLVAYKGASTALKAKYARSKELKKSSFVEGVALLEYALKSEPNNVEIRLIRLSIQENTPKIMNYKKNLAEDKAFIIHNFSTQTPALQAYVRTYVKRSEVFSAEEKALLR